MTGNLMPQIRRGEIHFVDRIQTAGCETRGPRPAVIVSNNVQCDTSTVLQVVYLTTAPKKELTTHVVLEETSNGNGEGSTVLCENIYSISKERLQDNSYYARVSDADMDRIDRALLISLDLERRCSVQSAPAKPAAKKAPEPKIQSVDAEELRKARSEAEFYKQQYEAILERVLQKAKL